MKTKIFISAFILITTITSAQVKFRSDNFFQIGYSVYSPLTIGSSATTPNNGAWAIEHWDGGLNIWKPYPSTNPGNYKVFINDANGYVGIGRKPGYMLDVQGDVSTYGRFLVSSDERLKANITPLSDCMSKLYRLNGKSYYKAFPQTPKAKLVDPKDSVKYQTMLVESEAMVKAMTYGSPQYGLLAQEVKTVFPDLVKEDSAGFMTVDYTGFIPVIIEALKEQKKTIDAQNSKIKELENRLRTLENKAGKGIIKSETIQNSESDAVLYQNIPNPFNAKTEIKYIVPQDVQKAQICIFNMQGTMIKSLNIDHKGEGSITIQSSELKPGMYLYSLINDGVEVDTKRMVLTE